MDNHSDGSATGKKLTGEKGEITPDLVREVAEIVFKLWQLEISIEKERRQLKTR